MKRFHIIDFTRWLEEEKCAVECRFYFEDEETAMEFLRHRHVYETPNSKIERIWQILLEDDSYTKAHEARKAEEAKKLVWERKLTPASLATALEGYQQLLAKGDALTEFYKKSLLATSENSDDHKS